MRHILVINTIGLSHEGISNVLKNYMPSRNNLNGIILLSDETVKIKNE